MEGSEETNLNGVAPLFTATVLKITDITNQICVFISEIDYEACSDQAH